MPRRPTLALLLAVVLVLAACNDDAATTSTTAPDTTTPTTAVTSTTETPGTTTTPGGTVADLIARFEETALRATYLFGAGSDQTEVTLSQDPGADPPLEAVLVPAADSKLITIGEQTIFCDTVANECFEVPGAAGPGLSAGLLGPFAGGLFLAGQLAGIPGATVAEDDVEVAGRNGICFTFTPPPEAGFETDEVTQCIDTELGFTLLLEANGETIMILTAFGEPLPEDFEPAGPVAPGA